MNTYNYITHYGIQWGTYPYYQGDKYDKLGVYFASFGCNEGIPYGAVKENFSFSSVDSSIYLSMFRNDGLREYYVNGLFKKKDSLVSKDDFIRNTDPIFAIPTEEELQKLLNFSYMHVTIGTNGQIFLIIEPYEEMKDGVKKIIGSIYIPLLGCVNYNGDNTNVDNITKYTTSNSEIKYLGYGDVVDIQKNSTQNPPDGYTYYEDKGNFNRYYQYYHTYSDVFLLTSDIPKDDNGEILKQPNEQGNTYARVLKITLKPKTMYFDSDEDDNTNKEDIEFLTFEIERWGFENHICGYGTSKTKDTAYMVLPIRYYGNINVNINGELLINNHAFSTFNQNANKEDIPYVKILPFGIPEIIKGKYNYTFLKNISNKENELSTYFNFPNGTIDGMSYFSKIEYLDTTRVKISDTDKGDTYWILSNNDCLYFYSIGWRKYMVFDDRFFFSSNDKSTTINISINFNYNDPYTIPDTRFVLPSIYKPFYIKRLYCIEPYYYEYDGGYECMYSFASHTNVYNGIGLFAHKGNTESNQVPLNNVTNNFISIGGETNGNAVNDLPSELKILLNSYFDGDNAFSKEYTYFYDIFKTEDMYAIGLLNDTIELRNSNNETIASILSPLPIFRNKPLILSDYNDSVYDFFEHITHYEYDKLNKNQTNIYVGNEFTSVMEPNTKLKFNDERTKVSYRLDFGDLFDKIHFGKCNPDTSEDGYPKCIDNFDSVVNILNNTSRYQKGIRYYFVNQAFYDNYITNWLQERTSEFIVYKQEYYNNREYYDLNPHKVDFKHNNIWDSSLGSGKVYEPKMENFSGYPERLYGLIKSSSTDSIVVDNELINSYNVSASADSKELYYAYLPIDPDEEVNFSQYYSMSFWIQNTSMATICIRATLANKIGVNSFSTQEEEDSGLAPYETIVIGLNEKRYVTIQGYPFSGSSTIDLFIRPKYKNVNTNEYYQIVFKISQVELREVKKYIPFFDMIPSLRNTRGYEYSDGDEFPNNKAPIALELYLSEDEKMLLFNPYNDCSNGSDTIDSVSNYKPLYLIGASTPLTRLEGACTDPDSAYVKHIKYNTELLPQMNSTSIIYSYGMVEDWVCKGYSK